MSSFFRYNLVQFLSALNENYFRFIIAFFLIELIGSDSVSVVMTFTGAFFLIPFLIFSTPGGLVADRFSKKVVMVLTRAVEFFIVLCALLAVFLNSQIGAYLTLFLMGSTSAMFGPAKYGLIGELSKSENYFRANGIVAAFTFLGIIIGTGLSSFIIRVTNNHFFLAVFIAASISFVSLLIAFFVRRTDPGNPNKVFSLGVYKEFPESIREMKKQPLLIVTLFAYAYFLLLGAFLQINIVPFTALILNLSPVIGGYLFFLTSVGIAIGAFLAPKLSKEEVNLKLIPFAGVGLSFFLFLLALVSHSIWFSCLWLILIGLFGGLFLVPAQTYILKMSPKESRGRNFGTANFLSFLFALFAPIFVYFTNTMLNISSDTTFLIFSLGNLVVMFYFFMKFK